MAMICQVQCPHEALRLFDDTSQIVSEASIDAKFTRLQALSMHKGEHVVVYLSRLVGQVGELQDAGHNVSEIERNARCCADCQKILKPW